jgi:hypothetical protein
MCNAWNHELYCECGFGGETAYYGTGSHEWTLDSHSRSLTHVVECWWCGAEVFFFRDERGGCALFDALGAPWEVHSCWEEYQTDRRAALQTVEQDMRAAGYEGSYDADDYEEATAPSRHSILKSFWGVVVGVDEPLALMALRALGNESTAGELVTIHVLVGSTRFPVRVLPRMAEGVVNGCAICVAARWLMHADEPTLFGTCLELVDVKGATTRRTQWRQMARLRLKCGFCGTSLKADQEWQVLSNGNLECQTCGEMRGDMEISRFVRQCRRIAVIQAGIHSA